MILFCGLRNKLRGECIINEWIKSAGMQLNPTWHWSYTQSKKVKMIRGGIENRIRYYFEVEYPSTLEISFQ